MRRITALIATTAAAVLVLAGCATIPTETKPQAVGGTDIGGIENTSDGPAEDSSAEEIVREFISSNAKSINHYETSRLYLDAASRSNWQPSKSVVILANSFDAVPAVQQPESRDEVRYRVSGNRLGSLAVDGTFIAAGQPYETELLLRRQPETNQWRIVNPPADVMTTERDFVENYHRVSLYFFAPNSDVRVPDPRYVVARPKAGLAGRVVSMLLDDGPSAGLTNAVDNPLDGVELDTNVTLRQDGALEVPLSGVTADADTRKRMIAQIVMSLEWVASNRVRVLSDGQPLLPERADWRASDLPSYTAAISLSADLPGMAVVNDRVVSMGDGNPISGPAGNGAYEVVSAAQSLEGRQLAVVERRSRGVRLRVGPLAEVSHVVDLEAKRLTRPTWRPARSGSDVSNELWTVQDNEKVVRVQLTPDGTWTAQTVNAAELEPFGEITALRLSRDGTRAAIVADKRLVVASVVRSPDSVRLRAPRILQPDTLTDVADVDWLEQDTVVAASSSGARPVVMVTVDGYRLDHFDRANLAPPVRAVTAAPGRSVVAANASGLWTASAVGEHWRQHQSVERAVATPFYPG